MAYVHRGLEACAGRQGRRVVPAFVATAFAQDDAEGARAQWRRSLTTCAQSYLSLPPSWTTWTRPRQMTATDWPSAVALQQSDTLSLYGGA
jgi:hypothetical protein